MITSQIITHGRTGKRVTGISDKGNLVPVGDLVQTRSSECRKLPPFSFSHRAYCVSYSLVEFLFYMLAIDEIFRSSKVCRTSTRDPTFSLVAGMPQKTVLPETSGSR